MNLCRGFAIRTDGRKEINLKNSFLWRTWESLTMTLMQFAQKSHVSSNTATRSNRRSAAPSAANELHLETVRFVEQHIIMELIEEKKLISLTTQSMAGVFSAVTERHC